MAPKKKATKAGISNAVPDSDHIVFASDNAKEKKKTATGPGTDAQEGPPKPDARKIIGGNSWTGKLPQTLLSELCQKQKWNKPDFSMIKMPQASGGGYRSAVRLSRTDSQTKETTTLPRFQLPDSHAHLADQPTVLEARHFAATYALFRVSSMKNIHMMLPPFYRDLWKGDFSQLKAADVADNKSWKYDADPFAADAKRHEIQASIEKRKLEKEKADAKPASMGLPDRSHAWARAVKVEMGQQIRYDVEALVREHAIWNPYGVSLPSSERNTITTDLGRLGFRQSHVQEAVMYCKDREETLEWLLIHVPEDDLPSWCLPPGYSAGISLASGRLERESKLKRLAQAGYSLDLCTTSLQQNHDDEGLAAEYLQQTLIPLSTLPIPDPTTGEDVWKDEMATLEAIFDDRFSVLSSSSCSVKLQLERVLSVSVLFRTPRRGYPTSAVPIISIQSADLPAYIRLSATQQAIVFARDTLMGDSNMIFALVEYLETNIPRITENPGSLLELTSPGPNHATSSAIQPSSTSEAFKAQQQRKALHKKPTTQRSDADLLKAWKTNQETPAQKRMMKSRQSLPAWSKQEAIVNAVQRNQCTIISGETGSGKSTQSVQFVLDHLINSLQGTLAKIVCTQPRRISALGLSDRVSAERCSEEGQEVGYIIRGDSRVSADTKITFMTTGVLLRRLQSSPDFETALADLTHIFVDEVHERTLDTDFLLSLIREALEVRKDLRLILMSATLDSNLFLDYFGGKSKVGLVHIEGRTFPVTDYYLDDILRFTNAGTSRADDDDDDERASFDIGKAIMNLGAGINYHLIADLVDYIDRELGAAQGGILIFLPGTLEIDRCLNALRNSSNILPLPLHASLTPVEQKRVFPPAPRGRRKVIACTNVAETSITIEDIVAVVDTGRVKETRYGKSSSFYSIPVGAPLRCQNFPLRKVTEGENEVRSVSKSGRVKARVGARARARERTVRNNLSSSSPEARDFLMFVATLTECCISSA